MRAIVLMFDSLNRHMLPPYNDNTFVKAPNFQRLADRGVTFDRSYVCSMPCMPARRDFHTARPNFLHCNWGPLEPFDDSVPEMLSKAGVYTHLASDHYHYWEDGGATYHNRYNSWEFFRGQEGDPWVGQVAKPAIPDNINGKGRPSDWINRSLMRREQDLPQTQTVDAGLRFIDRNASEDRWMLQIECFDPHEPFVSHRKYKDLYPSDYDGPLFDWPGYQTVNETPDQVAEAKRNYAALVSKCDASLGDVLDAMDRYGMWDDTMLIVWTDHGFMLGEHNCWAKNWMPLYEEVSHTPFFVWDPRSGRQGTRCDTLVQPAIDVGPTLLGYFGVEPTEDMIGKDLESAIASGATVRDAAIFGYFGNSVNVTDGRHVYMRESTTQDNGPLHAYTLMPTNMRGFKRLADVDLAPPFSFTRGMRTLKINRRQVGQAKSGEDCRHKLWDLKSDPTQQSPVQDSAVESRMKGHIRTLLAEVDAPSEQYVRLGLAE